MDEFENSIEKDSVPKENGLSTSLEIDPWSLRFVAEKTRARYASYVREHVSPAVNKFMASLFFFFSITKMSRLIDSSQSEFHMVFRPLPAKDILHNVSTNIHVAIFFLVLSRVETSAGWKSCKACKRWEIGGEAFLFVTASRQLKLFCSWDPTSLSCQAFSFACKMVTFCLLRSASIYTGAPKVSIAFLTIE